MTETVLITSTMLSASIEFLNIEICLYFGACHL